MYNGTKYYADASGKLYVNRWIKKKKKYYFLGADGTIVKNCMIRDINGNYYYVDKSGARVTNTWITRNGKNYFFGSNGVRMHDTWVKKKNGNLYYLGPSGAMLTQQWVAGNRYYVGANGAMMKDCIVDGYYLDAQGRKTVKAFSGDYIFVGDSRTEGMRMAIAPKNSMYIAKVSMGYSWLRSTAGVELQQYLQVNPDVTVILAFGVNDLDNIGNYINYYKMLIAKFPKTKFYVMSVNPINEARAAAYGYKLKNSQIVAFNKRMRLEMGKEMFLNVYKYLNKKGFETSDGVHYPLSEYRDIYNFVIQKIKK